KLRIAALQATLELHVSDRGDEVPVHRMLATDPETLRVRAAALVKRLVDAGLDAAVGTAAAVPGGGAAPDTFLEGPVVRVAVARPNTVATDLRGGEPPIVVRVADDRLVIDLR